MTTKFDQVWKSIEDDEMRREFIADDTGLAFQIKLLREKNGWTQHQLAERAGSRQETISQWENPNYGRYTLKTLRGLAAAFDVGLVVKFAPFSELVELSLPATLSANCVYGVEASLRGEVNANLTPERLAPPSFIEEQAMRQTASPGGGRGTTGRSKE